MIALALLAALQFGQVAGPSFSTTPYPFPAGTRVCYTKTTTCPGLCDVCLSGPPAPPPTPAIRAALDRSKLAPKPAPCLTPKEAAAAYRAAEHEFRFAAFEYKSDLAQEIDADGGIRTMTDARAIMRAVSVAPRCSR